MGVSDCGVCGKGVGRGSAGVCCERCEVWCHQPCVDIKTNSRLLQHTLLIFLCLACKNVTKDEWRRDRQKTDKNVQTETSNEEKAVQTTPKDTLEDRGVQTTTVEAPKDTLEDRGVQTTTVEPPKDTLEDRGVQTTTVALPKDTLEDRGVQTTAVAAPKDTLEDRGVQTTAVAAPKDTLEDRGVQTTAVAAPKDTLEDRGVQTTAVAAPKDTLEDRGVQTTAVAAPKDTLEDRGVQTTAVAAPKEDHVEREVQTAETLKERPDQATETARPRRTTEMKVKRAPIRIIGDSMMKNAHWHVKCNMDGSGCTSMSGAQIRNIKKRVQHDAGDLKDGLLIVQGGGNALEYVGQEDTVKDVVDSVKAVEGKGMKVAVVGIMRRPREGPQYERLRRSTNKRIQEEMMKMKIEWTRGKKGDVSFIDMDGVLRGDAAFDVDGVHLSGNGNRRMGERLREWVRMKSLYAVGTV
ncbi:uncharacterized protein LOC126991737 isoform X2 [Eriocheir sinensis]|uniref:uncharacterized protein LOC126991737 isoform X2 n=1 Tax=Eriocheir sinensis TaxID=95602 RepID=UPI0021CA36E8|nr:uncharacterized protein LOC126991737 isoform X2 [Eriocheir sinensis]